MCGSITYGTPENPFKYTERLLIWIRSIEIKDICCTFYYIPNKVCFMLLHLYPEKAIHRHKNTFSSS